ncbi:MAG TPA: DUF4339 domain-containing protein [Candidatus Omnitrophota bacterium]|nr:DUF4339 domain-containing protein [Candidatus Omnitrophota bacterium]
MGKNYFFGKDHQQLGPFDQETVKKKIAEGAITAHMLAWSEGMDNWKPAGQIQELSSLFKTSVQPPPLPQSSTPPPPLPGNGIPAGLTPLEEKAYRFATAMYRPWRGKQSPLGNYIRKNPKSAVYVSLGTVAVLVLMVVLFAQSFSTNQQQIEQQYAPGQQTMMTPPAGWQAQHRAVMDAQREISDISHDVYTYRRDRQDASDDFRTRR